MLGYRAIVGERESGSLKFLLGLPHTRRDVILGKLIGRVSTVTVAVLVGFAIVGVHLLVIAETFSVAAYALLDGGLIFCHTQRNNICVIIDSVAPITVAAKNPMSTMTEQIVFFVDRPEFLYDTDCTVYEMYYFGDIGAAAYIECDTDGVAQLRTDDRVVAVEDNATIELPLEPENVSDDPDAIATIEDIRQLHNVSGDDATGSGVTVVAMDSGIDPTHPVFNGTTVEQVDVTGAGKGDRVGHGTAVLGQITRLAPAATLIALRIFGTEGQTRTNVIMRAYEWLHTNTDRYEIVNMSWGSSQRSTAINRAHNGLIQQGIRDVVSAGNSGRKAGSPATATLAFSVGACTETGQIAEFSSYNPERDNPDVAAIGVNTRLAQATETTLGQELPGPWVKATGTSFSAPAVAGMVAKYLSVHPKTTPRQIMTDFERAARNIPDQPRDGAGLADYRAAVTQRQTSPAPGPPPAPTPNPTTAKAIVQALAEHTVVYLDTDWLTDTEYTVTRRIDGGHRTILTFEPLNDGSDETDHSE